ncbi:hypothetical protein PTSG_01636 [Salpingoeca rosetta]|uniref:Dolichol-phosphate mannosyltransferase subunit 1 n=1 Tax=Salpingoeca rosetta (strain ATCC 50818 / BSB-021) TaxID=946362 RepID=F2TYI3_SALR5|nr:uncharacterized protein PTSG_01636 [Salpingoeca rosetta]EGD78657.1 hypothetical protein PTSG_01636 [Salpingoeca rosetta]|eukprot:XP_004997615.1 hypothetical protein PTSG_01636 [Salpingoeca rosetta]
MVKKLSVVVPTYNETDNIRPLVTRLFAATKKAGIEAEVLIMDDESKGTPETERIVAMLSAEGYNVRIHVRRRSEGRGLSSAVLLGFEKAKYETMLCMDADLQHEPESVPAVAAPVLNKKAEFSVGSRNIRGGGLGFDWSMTRRLISSTATMLARPLTPSTDPMSGFFCTTKTVLNRAKDRCNPIGFKIGLEIMARCRCDPVADVAITFRERVAGESKLTMKQNIQYVEQLLYLYWDRFSWLLVLLALVAMLILLAITQVVLNVVF